MAIRSLTERVPVEIYLRSDYQPDREYVDGAIEERNLGELDHSDVQGIVYLWFKTHDTSWQTRSNVELRVQVSKTRYRVSDVCVMRGASPREQIVTTAPLICIEVLSPADSLTRVAEKALDYWRMGVENIWVLDPALRIAYTFGSTGLHQFAGDQLSVPHSPIHLPLAEAFAGL